MRLWIVPNTATLSGNGAIPEDGTIWPKYVKLGFQAHISSLIATAFAVATEKST